VRPRGHPPPAAPEAAPLLTVPPAAVARVELEDGGRRLTAVRGEGGWADANGRTWRAGAVSDLVDALGTLRPLMVVDPDPQAPADYGLGPDTPRLRVLGLDGRPVLSLELGEPNPAGTAVYARVAGRPEVVLIGGLLRWELAKLSAAAPEP
jgi:hypothetical protein